MSADFPTVRDGIQNALVSTVKVVNRLAAEDLSFQKTVNAEVRDRLESSVARLLRISSQLLQASASAAATDNVTAPTLEEMDDVEVQWDRIIDVVDTVFDKANLALDEYTGLAKRRETTNTPENTTTTAKKKSTTLDANVRLANIPKPQLRFDVRPNPQNQDPWKPILTAKPHALVPLEDSLVQNDDDEDGSYAHPYQKEIESMKYPTRVFRKMDPIPYRPLETTSATWVDTLDGVHKMLAELKGAKEIAIDLEHHDFRTYAGITCLMQISTREQDWLIDTLRPWRHQLECLNEVFADPKIIKVLHGAYMDVQWLQRDFGLYLVGYVDTYFACEALGYAQRNLAYLLKRFADFDADKKYQLADWRIRPLPEEMFFYARSDTHFLLHIYDHIRNELLRNADKDDPLHLLGHVLENSRKTALYRYEQLVFRPESGEGPRGWLNPLTKHPRPMSGPQFAVFRAVWEWRDRKAREADESPGFLLGQNVIGDIARLLPPDVKALHSLLPRHAYTAKSAVSELWSVVSEAKERGAQGPTLMEFLTRGDQPLVHFMAPSSTEADDVDAFVGRTDVVVERLDRSQLFGQSQLSSVWEDPKALASSLASVALHPREAADDDERILLPWQRLYPDYAEKIAEKTAAEEAKLLRKKKEKETADMIPLEIARQAPAIDKNQEFTLKSGVKRKATSIVPSPTNATTDPTSSSPSNPDTDTADTAETVSANVEELNEHQARKKAKKARKEARRAAQLEQQQQEQEQEQQEEMVPFDYSSAPSVLHPSPRDTAEGEQKRGKKQKIFNPYSQTKEGHKAAPKAPPIKGGRSITFRSNK